MKKKDAQPENVEAPREKSRVTCEPKPDGCYVDGVRADPPAEATVPAQDDAPPPPALEE